ncbi:MAG: serine/threonine protein kinase, partial [Verrucomicrobiaceae bacterium]
MEIRTAAPRIPDHEVLRCIGKGSYGEVWLARAVTGTLRAVKVVHREDFELERTFEREFEGIMKFEPNSRDHPGLVHILHVGRNDEEKFYYYVMELADDRERGSRVDAADYEPRTMGTDKATKNRLPVAECVEHGAQLAEGLAHLHECGLTHRDIKPSNIIFVNGKAKLADIGLVAAAGQMTFVGTEGFVPPEGPGTKLADIYSLGMVLYEMSTGKDRLQFPELPD